MAFPNQRPYAITPYRVKKESYESISNNGDIFRRSKNAKRTRHFGLSYRFLNYTDVTDLEAHFLANKNNSFSLSIPIDMDGVTYTNVWYEDQEISFEVNQNRWEITVNVLALEDDP